MFTSSGLLEKTFHIEFTALSLLDSPLITKNIYSNRKSIWLIWEVKVGVYFERGQKKYTSNQWKLPNLISIVSVLVSEKVCIFIIMLKSLTDYIIYFGYDLNVNFIACGVNCQKTSGCWFYSDALNWFDTFNCILHCFDLLLFPLTTVTQNYPDNLQIIITSCQFF